MSDVALVLDAPAPTRASAEFHRQVTAAYPDVLTFARKLAANRERGDDLAQETITRALEHHHQFRSGTNLNAWLFTICKNTFYSLHRKTKREVEDEDGSIADRQVDDHGPDFADEDALDRVMSRLDALPAAWRDMLKDIADGLKYDDVAAKHGLSVGTVKSRINRARNLLRGVVDDPDGRAPTASVQSTELRRIDPAPFAHNFSPATEFGPVPELRWLSIDLLRIDLAYQREIASRGKTNVRRIAAAFDWTKFGTVIVAPLVGGLYAIVDGQHRTIAAALCGIAEVPCQVILADPAKQAEAFSAINAATTKITPIQIHNAKSAARDDAAVLLNEVCEAAGVTICRYPVPAKNMRVGETLAVGSLYSALRRFGPEVLKAALICITNTREGNRGMIRAELIKSLCELLSRRPALVADHVLLLSHAKRIDFGGVYVDAVVTGKRTHRPVAAVLTEALRPKFGDAA